MSSAMNSSDQGKQECLYLQDNVWRKTYLTDHTYRNLVALICVNSVAIIPTILLNALAIFTVTKNRSLQSNSNVLLACLASSDLFAGMVGLTFTCRETSVFHRAILCAGNGILYNSCWTILCFVGPPCANQRRSLHCNQRSLEVPGNCHKTADKKRCTCSMGHWRLSDNSGNYLSCYYRGGWQNVLGVLDSSICLNLCLRVGLHF